MAKKPTKPKAERAPLREPHPREQKAIENARERIRKRPWRADVLVSTDADGKVRMDCPHNDRGGWSFQQIDAFGTTSPDFMNSEIMRLVNAVCPGEVRADRINGALAVVSGVQPENEVEAMLAVQMVATHTLMMQMASNAGRSDMISHLEASGNLAVKLARTFTAQVEALAKLRKPPEQRVVVEHVHVHPGAQAVVGNVNHTTPTGGGVTIENVQQSHAADDVRAVAFAPGSAVWSEDEKREAVPVTGSEREMPVPHARGIRGRSEG
jgi:hypothetical protein